MNGSVSMIFTGLVVITGHGKERSCMSNDIRMSSFHQGWLKVRYDGQIKWSRRYCLIDWDKALLFVAMKTDGKLRDWIKLLPSSSIGESSHGDASTIEIQVDNVKYFLQAESPAEHDAWLLALKRTAYNRVGGGIFGQALEETYKYALDKSSLVPTIVRQCCEHLLEFGSSFVGLFRVPGKQSAIKELRDLYDRGVQIELDSSYSPATISSLLKTYLQSLPEPIIPLNLFDEFLQIGSKLKYDENADLDRLKRLIENSLSDVHHAVLSYLCHFLKKLTEFEDRTKMDAENLALTFGNNLIRSNEESDLNLIKGHNYNLLPLIKALINQCDFLFSPAEPQNQSLTKSSGFSSFSSLLSTHEPALPVRSRSSSMPSIGGDSPIQQSFVTCLEDPPGDLPFDRRKSCLSSKKHRQSKMLAAADASTSLKKKFGKSFSHLKTTVSKAFQTSAEASEQIELMNELIDEKNRVVNDLTRSSEVQRLHYQEEKSQLNQLIEQLEKENSQLKSKLSPQ